ncbi:hypothetical protein ACB098_02G027200 [Castanea mollissima]
MLKETVDLRNTYGRRNREEKVRRRRRKEGYWQQKFQGLLSAPSQIAEKGAWEGSFSQIADIQDFVLNLEEREEGEGERKVASDNELNFRQEAERLVHLYQGSSECLCSCRKNLSNDQHGLTPCIREDVKFGIYVENLTEEYSCTMKDVTQGLKKVFYFVILLL